MKIIGIMLVFFSSSLTGVYFSNKLKKRIKILEHINSVIINIKIIIEAQSLTIEELFSALVYEKKLENFFVSSSAFLSSDYKKDICNECKKNTFLTDEDKHLFISFINDLGVTYLEGQLSLIDGYIKQFENKITKLQAEQNSKCRMYNSFGVLIGAFLSFVLS